MPGTVPSLLRELIHGVPPRARVLCLEEADRAYLAARGAAAEVPTALADPRLLSAPIEAFDAVDFGGGLVGYSLPDHQRMLGIAFRALAPGRGILRTAFGAQEAEHAVGALLRQSGFTPLRAELAGEARWFLARRA